MVDVVEASYSTAQAFVLISGYEHTPSGNQKACSLDKE